jgi:phosphate transport system substrate-binding protein
VAQGEHRGRNQRGRIGEDDAADFRVSITNAPGKDAYPISSFTYLLIPMAPGDATKQKVIKDFLNWMLDHGESQVSTLDYAPLPANVADKVRAAIAKLP